MSARATGCNAVCVGICCLATFLTLLLFLPPAPEAAPRGAAAALGETVAAPGGAAEARGETAAAPGGATQAAGRMTLVPNYFTEQFAADEFDLDYRTIVFTPDGSDDFYSACEYEISELPTDPAGGTLLNFRGAGGLIVGELIILADGATVSFYGEEWWYFSICGNGSVAFDELPYLPHCHAHSNPEEHFEDPRISALYTALNTCYRGTTSWMQLPDRVVVTWEDVPLHFELSTSNTFQIEMYFDGRIQISWAGIETPYLPFGLMVGLSAGGGIPPGYSETDLSALGCGPRPPFATRSTSVGTDPTTPVTVTLQANDDGLPDPPGALAFIITSLPEHGTLRDPGAGAIDDVPYTLVDDGDQVEYTPGFHYYGDDGFHFGANDGGVPPYPGDHATIEVSNNGASWTTVWENAGSHIQDERWWLRTYDVSEVADGQETVYLRWGMGPTDDIGTRPGWNIDDVEIWGIAPEYSGVAERVGAGCLLLTNAPNPFSPVTRIAFELPRAAAGSVLSLRVFDAAGRCVATPWSGRAESGRVEVAWDGRDAAGRLLPAGVYCCRLSGGGVDLSRRMALLR